MKQENKIAYDALLKFSWNEQIPTSILLEDTEALLLQYGAPLNKCEIQISHDRDHSYVKVMPNRSLDDYSPDELDVFGLIADVIESKLTQ